MYDPFEAVKDDSTYGPRPLGKYMFRSKHHFQEMEEAFFENIKQRRWFGGLWARGKKEDGREHTVWFIHAMAYRGIKLAERMKNHRRRVALTKDVAIMALNDEIHVSE